MLWCTWKYDEQHLYVTILLKKMEDTELKILASVEALLAHRILLFNAVQTVQ